jgi:RHS repeat-associated protein
LCEYDGSETTARTFIYGNFIDEVISRSDRELMSYYLHDHLYSPVALCYINNGTVLERYEYDAYGKVHILNADYTDDADGKSNYNNPYYFTGRNVDFLDSGNLKLQYNRNRYYDCETGRWLTQDPLGIVPNGQWPNKFEPSAQYTDSLGLYEYVGNCPASIIDPYGLCFKECVTLKALEKMPGAALDIYKCKGNYLCLLLVAAKLGIEGVTEIINPCAEKCGRWKDEGWRTVEEYKPRLKDCSELEKRSCGGEGDKKYELWEDFCEKQVDLSVKTFREYNTSRDNIRAFWAWKGWTDRIDSTFVVTYGKIQYEHHKCTCGHKSVKASKGAERKLYEKEGRYSWYLE